MGTVATRGAPRPGARAAPTVSWAAAAGSLTTTVTVVVVPAAVVVPVPASSAAVVVAVVSAAATSIVVAIVSSTTAPVTAAVAVSTATTAIATPAVTIALARPTGDILDRNDAGVQLATVGLFLGLLGLFHGVVLDEGVVALHVDANELAEGLEEHLQVLALGGLLVEVDNEESLGGLDVLAALILLALGTAIAAGELGAERLGDIGNLPVVDGYTKERLWGRKEEEEEIGFSPGKGMVEEWWWWWWLRSKKCSGEGRKRRVRRAAQKQGAMEGIDEKKW